MIRAIGQSLDRPLSRDLPLISRDLPLSQDLLSLFKHKDAYGVFGDSNLWQIVESRGSGGCHTRTHRHRRACDERVESVWRVLERVESARTCRCWSMSRYLLSRYQKNQFFYIKKYQSIIYFPTL